MEEAVHVVDCDAPTTMGKVVEPALVTLPCVNAKSSQHVHLLYEQIQPTLWPSSPPELLS